MLLSEWVNQETKAAIPIHITLKGTGMDTTQHNSNDALAQNARQEVLLRFCKISKEAIIPKYATKEAAGFDFHALESCVIKARMHALVRTGLCMEIAPGYEIQVRSRSGLALKHKIIVLNTPGTIDSDYRGELQVILANFGENDFHIQAGDRIAQGIVQALPQVRIIEVDSLNETERGSNGFGSTGV